MFHVDDMYHKALTFVLICANLLTVLHTRATVTSRNVLGFAIAAAAAYAVLAASFLRAACALRRPISSTPMMHVSGNSVYRAIPSRHAMLLRPQHPHAPCFRVVLPTWSSRSRCVLLALPCLA